MATRGFVDMENAADIGAEDLFERALHRDTAKVQDGVYPFNQLVDGLFVGKVADEHFLAAVGSGSHCGDI
jgi:hypothetical protein